ISYQFLVENTGDVTLTNVSVTDELVGLSAITYAWPGAAGVLLVGESVIATATYTVTADDVNAGNVHNSATAEGTPPTTPTNPTPTPIVTPPDEIDTPIAQEPGIEITKTVTSAGPYTEGSVISYQFLVENTGDVTLTNVSVTDELVGLSAITYAWPGAAGVLLVGESVIATATYTVTADDVNAGNVHNSATAEGTPPTTPTNPTPTPIVTPPDEIDTPIAQEPGIEITKTVTSAGPYTEGSVISYQFLVENTGDVTLTNVSVTDELVGLSAITYAWPGAEGVLEVGQSVTATATYVVTAADVNAGNVHNSATAEGTPPTTPTNPTPTPIVTPPDEIDTPIAQNPALELAKSVTSAGPYAEGSVISYQFVVTNTGDVTLTDVSVTDELPGLSAPTYAWPGVEGVLLVGERVTATATYVVTQADVNAGSVHNTATAEGMPPGTPGEPATPIVSPPGEAVVEIETGTDLSIEKTVDNATPIIGDNVVFTLTVRNAGPADATGVVATDVLASGYTFVSSAGDGSYDAATGLWTIGDLANGDAASLSITVTVNATGDYRNTASVDGNETDPDPDNNTDVETPTPMPRIVAIDDPMGTVDAGDVTPSVLGNDTLGADPATVPEVVLTPGEPSHPGLSMNPDGTITIAVDVPTGIYTYPYTICDAANPANCDIAIATIEVVGNPTLLRVVKSVATRTVNIGDLVRYTVTVENIGLVDLVDGTLVDTPPTGFSYVEGSMSVRDADGAFTLAPGHHPLRIGGLDIAAGADATIVYLLRVGAGVRLGAHVNEAVAVDEAGNPLSNVATAEVLLDGDPMLDDSLVFGTVFDDRDGDGWQDRADLGGVAVSGGFAPGAYVANSTTIDTGSGPKPLADASSPLLHGVDVGAIRARESEADPAPTVVIRQRLSALEFTDDFVLGSDQGVTVRMAADGSSRVERAGGAARGLNAAEPTVERRVSSVEGGYEVAYVISNQGIDERGIPGVRIASVEGLLIETDQYGRYHLADVHGGDWGRGRNFILKVDPATLPAGTEFTTANPLVRRVTPGIPVRFDFGVKLPVRALQGGREQLELELGEVLFAPDSAEVREAYLPVLGQVAERVNAYAGGEVVITADGDSQALAFARAGAVRDALEPLVSTEAREALEVVLRTRVDDPHSPVVAGATASGALLGTVLFDTDKSAIRPEFNGLLDAVAARLEALGGGVVVLVGHTDVRAPHAYNAALGLRRATAVYEALATRLRPEVRAQVRVESSGDPAAPIGTDAR
ncbi:OmpA family protein, partial [Luteimonas sp. MJ204]|uniref:DUF7507 domain-containing protein n=1 Tax=Luteimonas sp. MJ145 TaxID=3129234 RepID=UPI0031BB40C1